MKVTDYQTLRAYREGHLSRKRPVSQSDIARKLRGGWQGRVSAVERGEVKFRHGHQCTRDWAEAYDLSVKHFMRMVENARNNSYPLFEQPPVLRVIEGADLCWVAMKAMEA